MAVDAVVGGVEGAVLVPPDRHIAGERGVAHLGERLDPVDALAVLAPEPVGVGERAFIEPEIFGLIDLADPRVRRDRDQVPLGHRCPPPIRDDGLTGDMAQPWRSCKPLCLFRYGPTVVPASAASRAKSRIARRCSAIRAMPSACRR